MSIGPEAENDVMIVIAAKAALSATPRMSSEALCDRLQADGLLLQPLDLEPVLRRYPEVFRRTYKGEWGLALNW